MAALHQRSDKQPTLHGQAVCFLYDGARAPLRKSDGATIIQVQQIGGNAGWLEREGIIEADGTVILYKRVSAAFQTQEGTPNETLWTVGSVVSHPAWSPTSAECGEGKFHACSRPYFCDEFRSDDGDLYVAIRVAVVDLHAWDNASYPHKIAFREGHVLYQVNKWGDKIDTPGQAVTA